MPRRPRVLIFGSISPMVEFVMSVVCILIPVLPLLIPKCGKLAAMFGLFWRFRVMDSGHLLFFRLMTADPQL